MLKNYILTAIRNFNRNKTYAILNVVGLAVGMGAAFVIFSVINHHLSFDKHQTNYDNIYRVVSKSIYPDGDELGMGTQHPVANALKNDYAQLNQVTRVSYAYGDQINIKEGDGTISKYSIEEGLAFIEPAFFDIFTVDWIAGSDTYALDQPNTVILSLNMMEKFFGYAPTDADKAIGRTINLANKVDLEVQGVISNPPENTGYPFTILISYEAQAHVNDYYREGKSWNTTSSSTNTFLLVADDFDEVAFEAELLSFVDKYRGEEASKTSQYMLQPFEEIHFDERFGAYVPTVARKFLFALAIIAVFLIITASINFINLSTAQAANRAKEIGIRKAIGGFVGQLQAQFMAEIAVITAISLLLSLMVAEVMFIYLEDLIGQRLTLDMIAHPENLAMLLGIFIVVSVLSGLYPSVLLSRMNTVLALKSKINVQHSGGFNLRKILVVLQFTISQFLIIGTLVIQAQTDFFINKEVGFSKEAIISSYLPERDALKLDRLKRELLSSPLISDVSMSLSEPIGNSDSWSDFDYAPLDSENSYHGNFKVCDENYGAFWEIPLLAGRHIEKYDTINVVINRKIADLIGFKDNYEDAVGQKLETGWGGDKTIVGVSDNFHVQSLHEEIAYTLMIYGDEAFYNMSFKKAPGVSFRDAISHYERSWEKVFPEYVSDYEFYEEMYAEQYEYEQSVSSLLIIFSVISIMIGCLGLYGLISFLAMNKTKEIGVRKVLGASVWNILGMYSKEILLLIAGAFLMAAPAAYWVLQQWLDEFPFRIELSAYFFVLSIIATLAIALVTIGHRTVSSARLNPALTLKDE